MTWGTFPGGELDGKRPKILCPACRERARDRRHSLSAAICFACYRAELEFLRGHSMAEASHLQGQLPLEPVNHPRLAMLKVERARAPQQSQTVVRRRRAQIAARHAIAVRHSLADPAHPFTVQFPRSWLPFVVSR